MKKEKMNYQTPATESSQSWPSNAPVNAERKGYGNGVSEDW